MPKKGSWFQVVTTRNALDDAVLVYYGSAYHSEQCHVSACMNLFLEEHAAAVSTFLAVRTEDGDESSSVRFSQYLDVILEALKRDMTYPPMVPPLPSLKDL